MRVRRALNGDESAIAAVHVAGWRETYPGIIPASVLDRMEIAAMARYWRGALAGATGSEAWLAEAGDGSGIVGFGVCGPETAGIPGCRGEFQALYVLRRGQGRGLGRGLMAAMGASLLARGLVPATVWTLRENWRARAFYEKLGGRRISERPLDFDGTMVMEVAYVWDDLSPLAGPEVAP
ncbi:GNAT family N-acetyltransferase [Arenibaculum pallidiluteum]|uniref:GNAT family N-acetyltransferase n=1 Tax=Arenibaculum pallidiluteum TaxID=2812559 RepID=UPI001A9760E6|nr:GNAT family N-acetyltransferase [Arenibaculum pallidiluteum]